MLPPAASDMAAFRQRTAHPYSKDDVTAVIVITKINVLS
jgi:hypothetical protein